jgi:hypothetical protein
MAKLSGKDGYIKIGGAAEISSATYSGGYVTINTVAAHGKVAKDRVVIAGVVGMTDINGVWVVYDASDADTFRIVKTTAQSYSSGGIVTGYVRLTGWNLDKQIGLKDVSDNGSVGGKEFLADALYEVDGSFEMFIDSGVNMPVFGTEMSMALHEDNDSWSIGNGIITSEGVKLQVVGGDAVKVGYSFKGTGAWTRTDNH